MFLNFKSLYRVSLSKILTNFRIDYSILIYKRLSKLFIGLVGQLIYALLNAIFDSIYVHHTPNKNNPCE